MIVLLAALALQLNGTYTIESPRVDEGFASMTFSATITNNGQLPVSGPILLRHPNTTSKVWARFPETTIQAGQSVTISDSVTIPRDVYDSWQTGAAPAVYINAKDPSGSVTLFRIPLSRAPAPAAR
ncbi:MAG TPA: hypothetical protein VFB67_02780 [Candidatus Polarisedimenticolaceae bacterium]|nr:hypothetical protein [Candidatus Polarisedimenticolaceae bacterium]